MTSEAWTLKFAIHTPTKVEMGRDSAQSTILINGRGCDESVYSDDNEQLRREFPMENVADAQST